MINKILDKIFTLVPERIVYSQFWVSVRKRNLWLIYLRYGAVAMLISVIVGVNVVESIADKFYIHTIPLWLIALSILIYNIIFHRLWHWMYRKRQWGLEEKAVYEKEGFRSLHFALIQICMDFIALMLYIYFTGGVESPLYSFFIFHVIIGSLFLPGQIIFIIITVTILITLAGAILEYNMIIPHHAIIGLFTTPLYNNSLYLFTFFSFFVLMLYLSIYLTNSIAKELYTNQRSLTLAYRKLDESRTANQRYIMSVVHDLKTPIAAVITYLNMILDGTYGALSKEMHRPMERSKTRLSNAITTINNILYLSQLKLETDIDETSGINIKELFNEIYRELFVLFGSKEIKYSYVSNDSAIIFYGERKLLKLALSNILSNAYKYNSDKGKIEVSVEKEDKTLKILISDTGIGIPEEEADKIFNDFYRSSISKKKGIEGSGLGMSIASQVIKRYNGAITVKTPSHLESPGEGFPGTTFTIEMHEK